jgi:DNA-binding NarL/FixJ family response regulator
MRLRRRSPAGRSGPARQPDPRVVAAWRRAYPSAGLLVASMEDRPAAVAAVLDAGADDCLVGGDTRELAARVRALARRRVTVPPSGGRP